MQRYRGHRASVRLIVGSFIGFALFHSALASHPVKRLIAERIGTGYRNGLYRLAYNMVAVFMVAPAAVRFSRLQDQTIYRVPAPWSRLWHAVQLLSIGFAIAAARVVGLNEMSGLAGLIRLVRHEIPRPEPEAQGPRLQGDALLVTGPFRITRHPLNLAPVGVFVFFPHMTVNRAVLAGLAIVYLMLGSMHEELRLRQAYGAHYKTYQASGVPFYWPIGRR